MPVFISPIVSHRKCINAQFVCENKKRTEIKVGTGVGIRFLLTVWEDRNALKQEDVNRAARVTRRMRIVSSYRFLCCAHVEEIDLTR